MQVSDIEGYLDLALLSFNLTNSTNIYHGKLNNQLD